MRRLIAVAALLALVATACKIETNFGTVINADGSGTIIAEIGMDDEAKGFFAQEGVSPLEDMDMSDCPGARSREERRGNMTFWVVECDVADIAAEASLLTDEADSPLSNFSLTVTPDLVTVTASASGDDALGGEDMGEFDPALIEESFSVNVKVTMPGQILEHNATSRSGNTLTWKVPIFGGDLNIRATSNPSLPASGGGGEGGFPIWLIAVIAVVVLGGAFYFISQRKGGGAAPAAAGGNDAPPPPPPAG